MSEIKTTMQMRYELHPERTEAVWFYGDNWIGSVTAEQDGKSVTIDIYCDGETRYDVPYVNEDGSFDPNNYQVVRTEADWLGIGVTTDKELDECYKYWEGQGVEIHRYNSWFDLYTEINGTSEHLDCVTHTIDEAILQAEAVAKEAVSFDSTEAWLASLY